MIYISFGLTDCILMIDVANLWIGLLLLVEYSVRISCYDESRVF